MRKKGRHTPTAIIGNSGSTRMFDRRKVVVEGTEDEDELAAGRLDKPGAELLMPRLLGLRNARPYIQRWITTYSAATTFWDTTSLIARFALAANDPPTVLTCRRRLALADGPNYSAVQL